jgi:hypothetical protein
MRNVLFAGICSLVGCGNQWESEIHHFGETGFEDTAGDYVSDINCSEETFEYTVDAGGRPDCFAIDSYTKGNSLCGHVFYLGCFSDLGGVLTVGNYTGSATSSLGESECGNGFIELCVNPSEEGTYRVDSWLYPTNESDFDDEEHMVQSDPVKFFVVVNEEGSANGTVFR